MKTVLVLLSLALAVSASDFGTSDELRDNINTKINSVCNEVLGIPCKQVPSPPPPPPSPSPPPPTEPTPTPTPTPTPEAPPTPAPVPAPEPVPVPPPTAPIVGQAEVAISITTLTGAPLTSAQLNVFVQLLQTQVGGTATVTLAPTGRKLLADQIIRLRFTLVIISCESLKFELDEYVGLELVADCVLKGLPVTAASLSSFMCMRENETPIMTEGPTLPPTSPAPPPVEPPTPVSSPPVPAPPTEAPPTEAPPTEAPPTEAPSPN